MARSKLAAEISDTGGPVAFAAPAAGRVARGTAAKLSTALTLRPLLAPFKGRGRLFLRIEKMPQGASLSAGTRNGDASWSLASDELDDVTYQVPSHAAADHVLTIRVTSLHGGEATTLKVLDLPVSFSPAAAPAANEPGPDAQASLVASQLGKMQALFAIREAEIGRLQAAMEEERREREQEAELVRQRQQSAFDQERDRDAARHRQELEAERAALEAQIAALTARVAGQGEKERDGERLRQRLQAEFDQTIAKAAARHRQELEAQRAALEAQIAALTAHIAGQGEKERDGERLRQSLQAEFDQRLETASVQHQRQLEAQRAALQAEITALAARAAASEQRLQEEQQSREAYGAQRAAQAEQALRASHDAQLEAAQRRQEALSQEQREDIRQAAAADGEANLRSARERWNAEFAAAVQQARKDWNREQDALIEKLQAEHERHCHDLLAPQREKILMLEAALAKTPAQARAQDEGPDRNAAALQSLNDQLAAASLALAERERALEDAKEQLAQAELARAQVEDEHAAAAQQADRLLERERDTWQAQERFLREELSDAQSQGKAQIASLTARCQEAEARASRKNRGTSIHDQARIDALNLEVASLRTTLARQQAPGQDRSDNALRAAYSKSTGQDEQPAGRSKLSLLRDFCFAVCCITPLILLYPYAKAYLGPYLGDEAAAPMAPAPARPAPQAAAHTATVLRGVNMRKTASGKGDVVLTLKKGALVEILSTSGKWIEVGVKGKDDAVTRGWVYSTYLQADGAPGSR